MKGLKFRLSKKLLFIMMGSLVVLGGGSGAAAVFIGTDKILGPSYLEINGLSCTVIETVKIKRDHLYWVRKYVVSDQPGDGMARIRTAIRVAKAVQEKEKADLVQVAMIDKAGPKDRAQMRGRMIGAQVVYIPDIDKAPAGADVQTYSAYYLDGSANPNGEYYGMRIDLPLEDVETLNARLTDNTDCVDPLAAAPAAGHGAPAAGHGDKPKDSGHGEPSGHGEAAGKSEAAGHGAAPAAESHAAPNEGHGEEAAAVADTPKEEGGFLASLTGMIFGGGDEEKPAGADGQEPANAHAAPKATEPAPEPRTSAEGGKRWSKQTDADAVRNDAPQAAAAQPENVPPPGDGTSAADAAGAAWLAKLRGEAAPAAASGKPDQEASTKPVKASD